jgi:hypothetical protein
MNWSEYFSRCKTYRKRDTVLNGITHFSIGFVFAASIATMVAEDLKTKDTMSFIAGTSAMFVLTLMMICMWFNRGDKL